MGRMIALQAALSGLETVAFGLDEVELQNGMQAIAEACRLLCEEGVIQENAIKRTIASITTQSDLSKAVGDASFVIECAPENLDLKTKLFSQLEQYSSVSTILASTTSTFTPEMLFKNLRVHERAIVTHFWNPAHLLRLVEVAASDKTSELVFSRTIALLKKMNKHPVIVKKPVPGFIGNRLQLALFREAEYLVENGICSVDDIDSVVTYGFGRRLSVTGPFMSADFTGLDVMKAISEQLYPTLSRADGTTTMIDNLVAKKMLGYKSGRGFYDNQNGTYDKKMLERTRQLIKGMKDDINDKPCYE